VYEFKPGDRVAALHAFQSDNGSYAEYAVAPDWTTFHLPSHISFEEAATMPTAAMTAAVALYADMGLPKPYHPHASGGVILIYGVTSAVGAFAAKLARLSKMRLIIGVAGRGVEFASTLVDHVVDYRGGEDAVVAAIEEILAKEGLRNKLPFVFDAISEGDSLEVARRLVATDGGVVSTVLPPALFARNKKDFRFPSGVTFHNSACPFVFSTHADFGYLWSCYFSRLLQDGRLKPHPYEVIPGGLSGLAVGMRKLREGKASAVKYVYRIGDTPDYVPIAPSAKYNGGLGPGPGESTHPNRNFPFPAE
jgi:NADPH:quinone reductase-like Zn-dependent oxidoreductase